MRPDLDAALAALSDDVATALLEADENPTDAERDGLLVLWHRCQTAIKQLQELALDIEAQVVPMMPWVEGPRGGKKPAPVHVDGLPGAIERTKAGTRTTWEVEEAAKAVIGRLIERGEINHPLDVANALLRAAGVSYFRVGELEKLDIDPDEYRRREGGRPSLRFVS